MKNKRSLALVRRSGRPRWSDGRFTASVNPLKIGSRCWPGHPHRATSSSRLALLGFGGGAARRQADGNPCGFTPLALLLRPNSHDQIVDVGDPAAVIRTKMHMLLDNRGGAVGTNMNVREIQRQELVGAASDALQIFGLMLHHAVGVRVREIRSFAIVHGGHITA